MPLSVTNLIWLFDWIQGPTWRLAALLFVNVLWIPFFWWLLVDLWDTWNSWMIGMAREHGMKPVYLAIDVPKDSELTPTSMEAIFNQLEGAHGTSNWWEEHWEGDWQAWFSFEIVSIEGYVQYIIRCEEPLRDLVEAAVYAQYPDAEITEVKDYTDTVPAEWPNDDWDLMATEFKFEKPDAYPLKTYVDFEDRVRGELIDPMAALLEIMSKIGKGEQIWYQLIAVPIVEPDWVPKAQLEIDKLVEKAAPAPKKRVIDHILQIPVFLMNLIQSMINPDAELSGGDDKGDSGPRTNVLTLTPGEKGLVEQMERKTGKNAYKCRIRVMYLGKKDVFSKAKGFGPVIGAFKQFNDSSRNNLKVTKKSWTKAKYTFKKARVMQRQQNFYNAYKNRSGYGGAVPEKFVMNVEEMATIYHFPMMSVKAPMVKRTGAKKTEPPASLPIDLSGENVVDIPQAPADAIPLRTRAGAPEPGVVQPTKLTKPSKSAPVAPASSAPGGMATAADDQVTFIEFPEE